MKRWTFRSIIVNREGSTAIGWTWENTAGIRASQSFDTLLSAQMDAMAHGLKGLDDTLVESARLSGPGKSTPDPRSPR